MPKTTFAGGLAALSFLCASVATTATDGVHEPDVDARPAAAIGHWTIAARAAMYSETCEWFATVRSSSAAR